MPEYINGDCEAHCPTTCGPWGQTCPGGSDEYGCPIADFCMSSTVPSETNPEVECPAHCPVSCQDGDIVCTNVFGKDGCQGPDFCTPGTVDGIDGQECPGYCPAPCGEDEMTCWAEIDPANPGCYLPDFCMP